MHIILTIDYSPWSAYSGGAQRSTHNIAMAMAKRDHKVTVIYSKPPWEKIDVPENLPYTIRWANLYATHSKRAAFLRPLTPFSVNRKLREIIRKDEDTIVHSNGEEGGLVHRLKEKYRFGFISTPRHPHYPNVFFKYNRLPLPIKLYTALKEGKYLMQGSAALNADFCSPPSSWAAGLLGEAFNIPKERLRPVPNGVPEEFLQYHRKPDAENGPLVFFGRLSKTKGVDTLIKALGMIETDLLPEIWIIGRGDLKKELQNMVKQEGLTQKVTFKPWMTHDELGEALSVSGMTVLPSREENFSLAILSAMCVGSPTISTKVGGTPEIIEHNKTGGLAEADQPHELANLITEWLKNPEKCNSIGQAGSDYIRKNLTWDHTCDKFEELYRLALEKRN